MKMEGIVFDLDGTLVDSEPLHGQAWLDILKTKGLSFDWDWFERWIGKSDRLLAEHVIEEHALDLAVVDLQKLKRAAYYRLVAQDLQLFPGVLEDLRFFSAQLPIALATSSSATDVEAVFAALPIAHLFRSIVHADHVLPNLKPKPDPYLLAAKNIGITPHNAVALEDSVAGVKSAKTAGMLTLAVTNSHSANDLAEADHVFGSTAEAMDWLKTQL